MTTTTTTTGRAGLRITEAAARWLDEIGHRDGCRCPDRTGPEIAVTGDEARSIHGCADAAWMMADEMRDYDPWPAGALRSLRTLADRARDAARTAR